MFLYICRSLNFLTNPLAMFRVLWYRVCGVLTLWLVLPAGGVCGGGAGGRLPPNIPGLEGKAPHN